MAGGAFHSSPERATLVGVDAFRGGWVAATDRRAIIEIRTFPTFDDLMREAGEQAIVAVDIPIGHPERIIGSGREAEQAVRPLLKKRRSSVFAMPARAVVERFGTRTIGLPQILVAHRNASALARDLSLPPAGISLQCFSILPKVAEVDAYLRQHAGSMNHISESHPEVALAVLNAGQEMQNGKKTAAGRRERIDLLVRHNVPEAVAEASSPGLPEDDRIDALVMLLVARRIATGRDLTFPTPAVRDTHGLPIAIRV